MMDDILTVKQAAQLLHMHPVTLSEKARTGTVPATRWGRRWLFSKSLLLDFIKAQSLNNCTFERAEKKQWQAFTNEKTPLTGGTNFQPSAAKLAHYKAALKPLTNAKRKRS